jgi:hypothetical protein
MLNLRNQRKFFSRLSALTIFLLFLCFGINAQSGSSSIRGTVTDQQGNPVAGATVVLKSSTKSFAQTKTTNSDGQYVFTPIPPDTYTLEIKANGFKQFTITSLQALVDTPIDKDIMLEIGQLTEKVEITSANDAPLNTTNASVGNTLTGAVIEQLPLSARNTPDLLSLQPGVTPETGNGYGGSVNGGRSDQANVTLDGVDVNEQQGGKAFFSVLRVTPESLQEFRVTTTNADANAGRSSGAQVSLITRSGSNEWHGSGYFYFRPGKLFQANDYFNNAAGVDLASVKRQNYGGSLLGPIIKDKWFFSAFYERFTEDKESSVVTEVPLPSLGNGIVRYYTASGASDPTCPTGTPAGVRCLSITDINNFYKASSITPEAPNGITPGVNPAALAVLLAAANRYKANDTTVGDGLNTSGLRFNAPAPVRNNSILARIDGKLTSNQDVFFRGQYQFDNASTAARLPDAPAPNTWRHPMGVFGGHTWTINSSMVNKFTYGLTREAFTQGGDSAANSISFRFIYSPFNFSRTLSRITPVHNFVDDFTWVKGNHTISMGGNIRLISNTRNSFGSSYDIAITNPSYYDNSGADVLFNPNTEKVIFPDVDEGSETDLRDALTAVIGRFSQYSTNLQFGSDKKLQASGAPVSRTFKTEEYELYAQDSWRMFNNLTVNYGVRWSTSTPIYEANGIQVKPTTSLSDFFDQRVAGAFNGTPYNGLITVDLAGKVNGKEGYYKQDWNNFAPAISAAWSPNFKGGILRAIFGGDGKSTLRGGFRMTYDRIGSALAVAFDTRSTLGFGSSSAISANTYNVSDRLAPLFTGFNQDVRSLPGLTLTNSLTFPLQTPADEDQRIEQSLDDKLTTPYNYNYNISYGRELFKGITFEASYVGRIARSLLVIRDTAHFNNLRDPASGQDFYGVMDTLIGFRNANAPITSISKIAWFEKFVPGLAGAYTVLGQSVNLTATQAAYRRIAKSAVGGRNTTDYTFVQSLWDDGLGYADNLFIHPQYATFGAYSTLGTSFYNGMQLSIRKRLENGLSFDFNYTYSHSLDDASGNEAAGSITGINILNPLTLRENRGDSDFDVRHLINANFVYQLPFGKGRKFFSNSGKVTDWILGGWQLTGIYRWNTGFPIGQPYDDARWATNWNVQSNLVALREVKTKVTDVDGSPNLFPDPLYAYQSYRNPKPGEAGDRNILREPNYVVLDLGLYKSFNITENHKITFRAEAFNVTNTQRLTGNGFYPSGVDPFNGTPSSDFGSLTAIQGTPRVLQFAIRYDF